jgi:NADPH2:quinone reductase
MRGRSRKPWPGRDRRRIGDRVLCSARHAIAEYAVTDAGRATKIPAGMSFEEATRLPVALQTMHDALVTNGRLKKGESVLVQGASSGVGLMALKIAKLMGRALSSAPRPMRRGARG